MNDGFDDEHDSLQGPSEVQYPDIELTTQQVEIHRNLETIGPEIAAFYLDGIRILQYNRFETSAILLAHVARELDGSLRDILSSDQAKERLQKQLTKEVLAKLGDSSELKERKGHIASILVALNIEDVNLLSTDDARVRLAVRWINVAKDFVKFAHRHGAGRSPRRIEEFKGLWLEFEAVLVDLVGNFLNLLDRLDRIRSSEPTADRLKVLHKLLESEARCAYFFSRLETLNWLKPLKDAGWFDPKNNPVLEEHADPLADSYFPTWHALEYVVKISSQMKHTDDTIVDIVNSIINYTDDNGERIENNRTDLQIINIIATLPTEKIEFQHVAFLSTALKSKWKFGLVDQEIVQTFLPKLLDSGKEELLLQLLGIMLEVRFVKGQIHPIMNEYWLEDTLKLHGQEIAKLCGIEASQYTLEQIRNLANVDEYLFDIIQLVDSDLSQISQADFTELLVSFTSCLFQFAEPDRIRKKVQDMLSDPLIIIRRLAVKTISQHYGSLKHLFWEWNGNPLDEHDLKPEMYHLIHTNNNAFDDDEMERILQWIESIED